MAQYGANGNCRVPAQGGTTLSYASPIKGEGFRTLLEWGFCAFSSQRNTSREDRDEVSAQPGGGTD
jgi:hypothetical protein